MVCSFCQYAFSAITLMNLFSKVIQALKSLFFTTPPPFRQEAESVVSQGKKPNKWAQANKKFRNTPEWKLLRIQTLERENYTCQQCKHGVAQFVRHKKYPPRNRDWEFRKPLLSDLMAVCKSCARELSRPSNWDDKTHPWNSEPGSNKQSETVRALPSSQLELQLRDSPRAS